MIRDADDVRRILNSIGAIVVGFVGFVVNAGLSLFVEMLFFAVLCWGLWTVTRMYVRSLSCSSPETETGTDTKPAPVPISSNVY